MKLGFKIGMKTKFNSKYLHLAKSQLCRINEFVIKMHRVRSVQQPSYFRDLGYSRAERYNGIPTPKSYKLRAEQRPKLELP